MPAQSDHTDPMSDAYRERPSLWPGRKGKRKRKATPVEVTGALDDALVRLADATRENDEACKEVRRLSNEGPAVSLAPDAE